jgi:hypothetical protein
MQRPHWQAKQRSKWVFVRTLSKQAPYRMLGWSGAPFVLLLWVATVCSRDARWYLAPTCCCDASWYWAPTCCCDASWYWAPKCCCAPRWDRGAMAGVGRASIVGLPRRMEVIDWKMGVDAEWKMLLIGEVGLLAAAPGVGSRGRAGIGVRGSSAVVRTSSSARPPLLATNPVPNRLTVCVAVPLRLGLVVGSEWLFPSMPGTGSEVAYNGTSCLYWALTICGMYAAAAPAPLLMWLAATVSFGVLVSRVASPLSAIARSGLVLTSPFTWPVDVTWCGDCVVVGHLLKVCRSVSAALRPTALFGCAGNSNIHPVEQQHPTRTSVTHWVPTEDR